MVSRHWGDMVVRVCWEPDAGTRGTVRCLGREDFIDGPWWLRRQCGGEIPELSCVDRPRWRGQYRNLEEWLEMRSKYSGKLSGGYPLLA